MATTLNHHSDSHHASLGRVAPRMAKAVLPKSENSAGLVEIGACLDEARRVVGWTVDQLAGELDRDPKQVGRWLRGEERTQVDAVFLVPALRQPFVIALAKRAGCGVQTLITVAA